nr:MAG TPA: tail tape measure [Caudoviricetes sp.]
MAEGKQSRFDLIINAVERVSGPFRRIEQAMEGMSKGAEKASASMEEATQHIANTEEALHTLHSNAEKLDKSLGNPKGLQRLSGSIGNVRDKLQGMVQQGQAGLERLGALAGRLSLLFGAAGGGAFALGTEAATAAAEASKFASMVGLSTGNWQEYAGAATMAGMEADELASLMLTLQERAVNAARGEKGDIEMLKLMGISAKNAKGELKNADTLLLELADRVKKMREAGEMGKAAGIMNQLGGEEGARLLDLLKNGREGLLAMRKEARELGLVLSDETLESALEYGSAINRAKATFRGLGLTLGTAFLLPLTKLLDKFQAWLQVQRDIMSAGFEEWVNGLNLNEVWASVEGFFEGLKRLASLLQRVADLCGGWSNVLLGLVALISGKALLALGSLALAFGQLGMAMLATPVGWFVAAIAGVAYAIHKNGEGVRKAFEQGWLRGLLQIFLSVMDGLNELVATLTGVDLYSIGGQWIDGLLRGIKQGWQELTGWLDKGLDSIAGIFRSDDDGKGTTSGAATSPLPMSDPLNMVPGAKSMMQLVRSERVIRQENTVRIIAPEGMRLEGEGQGRGLDVRGDVAEAGVLNAGAI